MNKTYLRVFKNLRILNDGSIYYKYNNGCKTTLVLQKKDITNDTFMTKNLSPETSKITLSYMEKYKKKYLKS